MAVRPRGATAVWMHARGDVIVFIDSDLVVTETFLISHAHRLEQTWRDRAIGSASPMAR